jgi:hypothetical protein
VVETTSVYFLYNLQSTKNIHTTCHYTFFAIAMILIQQHNDPTFRFSNKNSDTTILNTNSSNIMPSLQEKSLQENSMVMMMMTKRSANPKKPSLLTKRTSSLPVYPQKSVKTKNLFWFIPRDQRNQYQYQHRINNNDNNNSNIECNKTSQKRRKITCCTELSDNVALQWQASASCTSCSESDATNHEHFIEEQYDADDADDNDCQLFGLQFIESQQTQGEIR